MIHPGAPAALTGPSAGQSSAGSCFAGVMGALALLGTLPQPPAALLLLLAALLLAGVAAAPPRPVAAMSDLRAAAASRCCSNCFLAAAAAAAAAAGFVPRLLAARLAPSLLVLAARLSAAGVAVPLLLASSPPTAPLLPLTMRVMVGADTSRLIAGAAAGALGCAFAGCALGGCCLAGDCLAGAGASSSSAACCCGGGFCGFTSSAFTIRPGKAQRPVWDARWAPAQ